MKTLSQHMNESLINESVSIEKYDQEDLLDAMLANLDFANKEKVTDKTAKELIDKYSTKELQQFINHYHIDISDVKQK